MTESFFFHEYSTRNGVGVSEGKAVLDVHTVLFSPNAFFIIQSSSSKNAIRFAR